MSKFTPGPWVARRNSAYWEVDPVWGGEDGIPHQVADVCPTAPGDPDGGLQEANARLIAAAPDMYEALQLWVAYNDAKDDTAIDMMTAYADALAATRAALAKATGNEE